MKIRLLFLSIVLACDSDKSLTVQNPSPQAEIVSHEEGSEVLEGFSVEFVGSVTDSNHLPEELVVTWYVGSDVVCEAIEPESDGSTTCEVILLPNDIEVTLEVKDLENARGSETIELVVTETEQPSVEIISPVVDGVYYSDQLITFEGILSDNEDSAADLIASWESNIDGIMTSVDSVPDENGEILGYGMLSEGQHAIELEVEDTTGKTSRESVIISVGPPNSNPTCEITAPLSGLAGAEGDLLSFTATAEDIDVPSDWLSVAWNSDKDGEIGSSIPFSTGDIAFSYSGLSVNTHNITMVVTDEVGATCTTGVTYTVGTPPSIIIDSPAANGTYSESEFLDFVALVSDDQDQANEISLDWSLNGISVSSQSATSSGIAQYTDNLLSFGSYTLVVTATDTDGLTDSDQVSFIINGLPTMPGISISPDPAHTTDSLAVSIDSPSIDPEGNTISYSYEWLLNNVVQSSYVTSTIPSSVTNKGEEWMVRVIPSDGIVSGTAGEAVIIIQNTPPSLSGLSITPVGTVYNDETLTCTVSVTDPDEILMPNYEWVIDGNIVSSSSTLDLASVGAMPDDVITCVASVTDGDGEADSDSITKTIENRPPTVSNVQITSGTGSYYNDEIWTCSAITSDGDEIPAVSYVWSFYGAELGYMDTLDLASTALLPNDDVVCTVIVSDSIGETAEDSATQSVGNRIPSIPTVAISWSSSEQNPLNSDDLTCVASDSVDSDGQSVSYSYSWTSNNGGSVSGAVVYSSDTSGGETWTCEAIPFDGIGYGAAANESVLVQDQCPDGLDGSLEVCPALDCAQILTDGFNVGDGLYWIDPQGSGSAYEVYCLMDNNYDGGGWTLVSVHSDDGQDTWTWNNRHYFDTDTTTFGSLSALDEDFKSRAYHETDMQDILFIHSPSGVWAGYDNVNQNSGNMGALVTSFNGVVCYTGTSPAGYPQTSGTLTLSGSLCSTDLYFNAEDHDGGHGGFGQCNPDQGANDTYGPTWSGQNSHGCPFDDPGLTSGLGPTFAIDASYLDTEYTGGFALYSNLVSLPFGNATPNYFSIYVR